MQKAAQDAALLFALIGWVERDGADFQGEQSAFLLWPAHHQAGVVAHGNVATLTTVTPINEARHHSHVVFCGASFLFLYEYLF